MKSLAHAFWISMLFIAGFVAPSASAQILAYDGFDNGPRADLDGSAGGTGWTSAWISLSTDPTTVGGSGLNYPRLDARRGGAVTPVASGVYPQSVYARAFVAPPSGTNALYVSFLMRADAGFGSWGGLSFGSYPYAMSVGAPPGMYAFGLMTSHGLGSITNRSLVQDETVLLVVKISTNAPAGGVVYRLYLDPVIGAPEPAAAAAVFAINALSALPAGLSINNGSGFTTDELRVGTTWASVLPAEPFPWTDLGFAKPGLNGAPRLTGSGPLLALRPCAVSLANGNASSLALLVIGTQAVNAPLLGGVLVPDPAVLYPLSTDNAGSATLQALWPAGIPPGDPILFQLWVADPSASFGWSASNGLRGLSQ